MNSKTRKLVQSALISALAVVWVVAASGMYGSAARVAAGYVAAFSITMAFVHCFMDMWDL